MSDIKKIDVIDTIKDGVGIGIKNIGPIIVNIILWVLTCWIPYLNIGTTIGLFVGVIAKASKGETIPMTEIFNAQYRKYMGEFFLTAGLMGMGIIAACIFFIIPGIVLGFAWSLAILLAVDKGKNPAEALSLSNQCTYGNKLRMFAIYILVGIASSLLSMLFGIIPVVGFILTIAVSIFFSMVGIGIQASIYKQLAGNV